jgi:dUTP pyrophosphatase
LYARITGRSSSLRKYKLLINEGIIDNGFTGELFVCVHNMGDEPFKVEKGMRLAQVLFHTIEDVRWSEVDEIKPTPGKRGDNGFGSTGV